ncbi:hypothetical protein JOC95_002741 [Bacillus tianshenii]|uniref:MEDS domain-containing protein n=1 Tax=Sutcliffiella tianshenii TaxID=1463404 RepID=A0ABS2P1Y6_9BACI|nr:hypothetical protein [Bacillus tianshenii]
MRLITTKKNFKIEAITDGHVFYRYRDQQVYLNNLIAFISSGLKNNQHILIVESMKNIPKLKREMEKSFSKEQISTVRLVNNFDYYFAGGDFNTQTILDHFQKDITILKNLNPTFRTWAHVEWASDNPDATLLKEYESEADDFVTKENLISVCAYSQASLTPELNSVLEQVHNYVMTDDEFYASSLYRK